MATKKNPLKLNSLQLKTLAIFQELALHPETSTRMGDTGEVLLTRLPAPHGNHFHIGARVANARDATGLKNPSVWQALIRKGLIKADFPIAVVLTAAGIGYDTGVRDQILLAPND